MEAPLLLTVEEAAQSLGSGRTTVYALVASGQLEASRSDVPGVYLARP